MGLNKPKFHLFRNTYFALQGLREVFRNESSFRIEVLLFAVLQVIIFLLPVVLPAKAILSTSIFLPLFAELANSAIERNVDLVTMKYDSKAKAAKDAGSAMVFVSFLLTGVIWFWTAFFSYFLTSVKSSAGCRAYSFISQKIQGGVLCTMDAAAAFSQENR